MSDGRASGERPEGWRAIWVGVAGVVLGSATWGMVTALMAHLTVHFH